MKYPFRSLAIFLAVNFFSGVSQAAGPSTPPNIVVIYGDDIGYGDFSCYGATAVKTPNVDRLASGGLRFTSAYATAATCTPSRFSMLTGEYAFRQKGTGILAGDAKLIIKPGRETLPAMLRRAGYATAVVGKWHLGLGEGEQPLNWNDEIKPSPLEVGFDYSFIMAATGDRVPCVYVENHKVVGLDTSDPIEVNYKKPFAGEPTGVSDRDTLAMDWSHEHNDAIIHGIPRIGYMKGGKSALWQDDEMAKMFVRKAVDYIEREKAHPFFLYFASQDIHVPRVPNKDFVGKTTMGPRGDTIVEFDWSVGQIVAALERLKLLDNTLIILTSDNGPVLDDGYKDQANEKLGDHKPAGPFRGGKYSRFEGGTRMPFLTYWPGKIKPGVSEALISQVDLLASFAALTGQSFKASEAPDSQNMLPALLGKSTTGRASLVQDAWGLAIRQGDWKFLPPGRGRDGLGPWMNVKIPKPGLLFDLSKDPGETKNLASAQPGKLKELSDELKQIAGHNQME
jgi:arylsulfatase A-like enzyme